MNTENILKGNNSVKYYCPSQCEKDKYYTEQGTCPVCKQKMWKELISGQFGNKESSFNKKYSGSSTKKTKTAIDSSSIGVRLKIRMLIISVILSIIIFLFETQSLIKIIQINDNLSINLVYWLQFFFTLFLLIYSGGIIFKNGLRFIKGYNFNYWTLPILAIGILLIVSIMALVIPEIFLDQFKSNDGTVKVYFSLIAFIITLSLSAHLLKLLAHRNLSKSKLISSEDKRKLVSVLRQGIESKISKEKVVIGDTLKINPKEEISLNGYVASEGAFINESKITGVSTEVVKLKGENVFAGTVNGSFSFLMKTLEAGTENFIEPILKKVDDLNSTKSVNKKFTFNLSDYLVPIVILISIITFFAWIIWGEQQGIFNGFISAISVLLIACPMAFHINNSLPSTLGVNNLIRNGIYFNNIKMLEKVAKIDTVVVCKSLLEEGKPELKVVFPTGTMTENEVLTIAASLEMQCEHTIANSIVELSSKRRLVLSKVSAYEYISGKGVTGIYTGKRYGVGNIKLLELFNARLSTEMVLVAKKYQSLGYSVVYLISGYRVEGILALKDRFSKNSTEAINSLKEMGISVNMITGDGDLIAKGVASKFSFDEYRSETTFDDKLKFINELQNHGRVVGLVLDKINDKSLLAHADVGIIIQKSENITINNGGDIKIFKDGLKGFLKAIKISKQVVRNIKLNNSLIIIYNALALLFATGLLHSFLGILNPTFAIISMISCLILVLFNVFRLKSPRTINY